VYCLDATFLIDLQAGAPEAVERARRWEESGERITVPLPALIEWLRGAYFKGGRTLRAALELAENLEVLSADAAVGHDAARFGADVARKGRALSASDLLIAGIVRHHHAILVTRDQDFSGLPGLPVDVY
jgi:predicted nucleic acid-binding protein